MLGWRCIVDVLIEIRDELRGLHGLYSTLSGLPEEVARLRTDVTTLHGDVSGLKANVASLKANVASLTANVVSLRLDLGSLARVVGTLVDESRSHGRLLGILAEEQGRLSDRMNEFSQRLSTMLASIAQSRTEDVARFINLEERLHRLES